MRDALTPEKIGKYQIVERLGSGGMGTIFKAHDPVLDRLVALKVISTDMEITDELRARFFREAQACARLSHPNIVTVYTMGDDDGRLFIVMELLEGEELKHLIAQRKALALEDKLAIMVQVCDGLHYAHQHGIVHRDIKPGNIFLQRSGQVKILDFGIAQMANAEGLTRAGLIMGSLRYISPEQVRGRVDHRSDIFSLGAVLYEFLSMRPPFTGADPIRLLEQLRTEEPPALDELDPTIPSELAAVVARAMRKDPAERFTDLEQMRSGLEEVQRGLTEESRRVSERVRDQRGQLLQLRAALVERVGPAGLDDPVPTLHERARLTTIRELERDLSARIEALHARIARADSLAPALRRATELLRAGLFSEAVGEFAAILAAMPEHVRALDGLEQARAHVEGQRRRQLAAQLAQDARAALEEGSLSRCLEILEQVAQIPPPAEALGEIAALRATVEAAVAARAAARRAWQEAEGARGRMEQARRGAQSQAGPRYAPALWNEAEVKSTEASTALAREAYVDARESFEMAITVYGRVEEAARDAQRREHDTAEQARAQATQSRERAQAEGAPQYAPAPWDAAEARLTEAEAAFVRHAYGQAGQAFDGAAAMYGRLEEAAREARRHERAVAEHARELMVQARRAAELQAAPQYAPGAWDEAEATCAEAEGAFSQEQYATAADVFDRVRVLYQEAAQAASMAVAVEAHRADTMVSRGSADGLEETILQSEGVGPGSRYGLRRITMAAAAVLAVIGLGALLWLPREPLTAPPSRASRGETEDRQRAPQPGGAESAAGRPGEPLLPEPKRGADPPVPPPSPRSGGRPLTPRQALHEVFEGRNRAHSVTATVPKDAVRIGRDNLGFSITSSRPGYVYVMVVRSNGSDVELLLPNAVERNNYIESGQPLKLPGPQWPLKAQGPPGTNEFFAIVSDEPRDFSALGPTSQNVFQRFRLGNRRLDRGPSGSSPLLAGTVACVSAARCSESYGAVAFSIDTVGREPEVRAAARRPPPVTAPAPRAQGEGPRARTRHETSPRCSSILERASLGEPLTDEEQAILTRDCR